MVKIYHHKTARVTCSTLTVGDNALSVPDVPFPFADHLTLDEIDELDALRERRGHLTVDQAYRLFELMMRKIGQ